MLLPPLTLSLIHASPVMYHCDRKFIEDIYAS